MRRDRLLDHLVHRGKRGLLGVQRASIPQLKEETTGKQQRQRDRGRGTDSADATCSEFFPTTDGAGLASAKPAPAAL
jgi:hypothetical protein